MEKILFEEQKKLTLFYLERAFPKLNKAQLRILEAYGSGMSAASEFSKNVSEQVTA